MKTKMMRFYGCVGCGSEFNSREKKECDKDYNGLCKFCECDEKLEYIGLVDRETCYVEFK